MATPTTHDESDARVYLALGLAVARAQEVEVVMVRLLEQQRQDTSLPLDERWDEIFAWVRMTAGDRRKAPDVPDDVAADLAAAVGRRNRVVHDAWMIYSVPPNRKESAATLVPWLHGEATMLMQVRRGLARLTDLLRHARASGAQVDDADVLRVWREYVPEPIAPREDR